MRYVSIVLFWIWIQIENFASNDLVFENFMKYLCECWIISTQIYTNQHKIITLLVQWLQMNNTIVESSSLRTFQSMCIHVRLHEHVKPN